MIIVPELQKQPRVLKVELRKMSSSSELNQPRLTDQYEQGPQITTITSDRLDYTILKKGYRYGTLTCDMVAGFKETGKPMLITIERLQPGQMKSDVSALSCAQSFLQADLAAIGRGDPLRGELVAVLRENLEQVKNAGQYEKWDPRHEVDATLRALRAEQ